MCHAPTDTVFRPTKRIASMSAERLSFIGERWVWHWVFCNPRSCSYFLAYWDICLSHESWAQSLGPIGTFLLIGLRTNDRSTPHSYISPPRDWPRCDRISALRGKLRSRNRPTARTSFCTV